MSVYHTYVSFGASPLQLLLALSRAVFLGSESPGTHDYILSSQIQETLNLKGQVPVFIFPRNRRVQFYPQTLGSLFVASYHFRRYGRDVLPATTRSG
jgi:hypothetical protein